MASGGQAQMTHATYEPATEPYGRVEDEPVFIRLRSARRDRGSAVGGADAGAGGLAEGDEEDAEPVICLTVMPFNTWQMVKRRFKERWPGLKVVPDMNIRLLYKSVELRSGLMVDDYNIDGGTPERPAELQYLIIDQGDGHSHKGERNIGLYVDSQVPCTQGLKERVAASLAALLSGIQPRLTDEGTGATYMLRDASNRRNLAVFKPKDEEAFAPQNPRGYVGQENSAGLRQGVLSTQQAAREVAAYLLDHEKFAGVPETTLVHGKHPKLARVRGKNAEMKSVWKIGALQAFVETGDTAGNFAPQVFGAADVHRIGILDIRIVNLDRNDGNLLVRRGRGSSRYELIPIDHGLSLPDRLEVFTDDIAWMSWPQAHKPLGERELTYIANLNGARDAKLLARCLGVRRECLRLMEVTTRLLQIGAEHGLTLREIGSILYRVDRGSDAPVQPSRLEQIVELCLDAALAVVGEGLAGSSVSATLLGLDLQTSRQMGSQRLERQTSSGGGSATERDLGLTPQLRPTSPFSSPLSMSPHGGEMPHLSLDGLSEPEVPGSWDTAPQPSASAATEGKADEARAADQLVAVKQATNPMRQSPKASSGRLRSRTSAALAHRGGESGPTQGSIFSRPNLQQSDWTSELEHVFRRQVTVELTDYIRKNFRKSSPRRQADDAKAGATGHAAPADGLAGAVAAALDRADASAGDAAAPRDDSLASALPLVLPPDSPPLLAAVPLSDVGAGPARPLYVPPHLRRASAEVRAGDGAEGAVATAATGAACKTSASAAVAPTPSETSVALDPETSAKTKGAEAGSAEVAATAALPPLRQLYVPPQRRGLTSAAAAEAEVLQKGPCPEYVPPPFARRATAAGAEAATDGAHAQLSGMEDVATPSAASTALAPLSPAVPVLPRDASGGDDRYGFCVNQGPRASMEDAVDVIAQLGDGVPTEFYAIYDGHSGAQAVEFVKRRLPLVLSSCDGFSDPHHICDAVCEAFRLTDEELLEHLLRQRAQPKSAQPPDGSVSGSSGCVACIALVRGTVVHVANLGDCRALMCCHGEMMPLTVDHRPGDNEGEHERLRELGVEVSVDGYLHSWIGVSRAFGDWAWEAGEKCKGLLCRPELSEAEVAADAEFLLLACDGVFENMTTKEAGQIVRRRLRATGDAKTAAEDLVRHALKRSGSDNLSAVVVLFKQPPVDMDRMAPCLFAKAAPRLAEAPGATTAAAEAVMAPLSALC